MDEIYVEDKDFKNMNFSQDQLAKGDYENCKFENCTFSNADLSGINFSECIFEGCDFSLATITKTAFRNVKFKACKLLGLHFEDCNEFLLSMDFEACQLNLSSFYMRPLKDTIFKDCSLQEVDFTGTDLTNSVFKNCDLKEAKFEKTILKKTDFRSAFNYSFDPDLNRISKAKFAVPGVVGLLNKYDIEIE